MSTGRYTLTSRSTVTSCGPAGLVIGMAMLWGAVAPAAAQSPPQVLFQSTFDRTGGQTNIYRSAFPTCDPTGSYRLVLDNGVDGTRLVSSGSVLLNGLKVLDLKKGASLLVQPVALRPANDLEVRLGGSKGGRVRVTVDGSPRCLGVRITAPLAGSVLAEPAALVEGDVDVPGPVGVRLRVSYPVPGSPAVDLFVPAEVNGPRFAAWLPLAPGTLQLTALASDEAGRSGETTLTVTFVPDALDDDRASRPDVSPTAGFAPLTVTFGGAAAVDPDVDLVDLDVDGDGVADFTFADFAAPPHQVTYTYVTEGLYVATLSIRDRTTGRVFASRVPINVLGAPDLGAAWSGFRAALGRGDVDAALWFIAFEAQERYRRVLEDLRPDLVSVAASLQDLTPLVVNAEYATAATTRVKDGVSETFLVSFVRDGDGVWRIASL